MLALKKLYGDELLRLALILSLLKANPNDYLERETQLLTAGLHISNGTDWSLEQEARTLITPRYVHPKSLDQVLAHHERRLFEELNSLGRYYDRYSPDNERISHVNPIVHTYLVNNVATDTIAPTLAEVAAPVANDANVDNDIVSADDNVGQEIKVEEETQQEHQQPDLVVTLSPDFLNNRTESDIFAEIATRSFDVSEFLVGPSEMQIKKEPDDDLFEIKKEKQEQNVLYSDNAMDDFVPYFAAQSKKFSESDVFDQNISDLQDYEEAFDDLKDFKKDLEYLDVKQQQENLEQYLLENTPLDAEVYDLAPIFEEELVLDVKRERASTSFTSASSSGVSDMEIPPELSEEIKTESDEGHHTGDELTQEFKCSGQHKKHNDRRAQNNTNEHTLSYPAAPRIRTDMDLIEVLWKQDVDMGFSLNETHPMDGPQATKVLGDEIENALKFAEEELQKEKEFERMEKEKQEIEEVKASLLKEDGVIKEDDPWAGLAYTVDTETGECVLQCDGPEEAAPDDRFDFLEEALQLVELGDSASAPAPVSASSSVSAPSPAEASSPGHEERVEEAREEGAGASAAMLHPAVARHALPHHHHHLTAHYHNQSLMRSMSVEQRWQDLASLLTIPPPPPEQYPHAAYHPAHAHPHHAHQQHPHNISAHGAAGGYPNYGHLPATADKHPDAYGAATPLDGAYKVESAHHPQQHEGLYYQNGGGGEMGNSDGFLQSILNDEDLQLMDMAMNEGMYTMRMLDGSGAAAAHPPPPLHNPNIMMTAERDSASDSAVSSMGSERVPSLSDGEWCDAGSDSAQEYHSSKFRPYEASFGRERAQQPPQKKHHMFGKRCFQEPPVPAEPPAPVKYEYPPEQPAAYHRHEPTALAPTVAEYPSRHAVPQPHTPLQPVLDLNAAHSSHALIQGGVAPMGGRYGPYPAAAPERVRHNHTYSAPLTAVAAGEHARPAVRDKRVRRLTDGSMSDGGAGSTSGHLTRDEKRAKALGIPLEVHDIINLPMDEFNERLSKHDLSEAQLSLIRDIRRRGKNKVAAQNCRKRKLDQITSLADEVRTVRDRKVRTQRDHQTLLADRQRLKERFAALYRHVFQNLRDAEGRPLSSAQYSLQQAADGSVVLVPKMNHNDHPMNRISDDEVDRKAKNFEQ